MAVPEQSRTTLYRRRLMTLKNERASQGWDSHWKELAEYFAPERGRYLIGNTGTSQHNDGRKKHSKIINGSSVDARRTLAGGLQGGLTSPTRPWFQLTIQDKDLAEYQPVREYLQEVRDRLLAVFARSNFYGAAHGLYDEVGVFGTSSMLIEEDPRTVIRVRPLTIGEYSLSLDHHYRPETLYRQFTMTAEQLKATFPWENLSRAAQSACENGNLDVTFEVVHVIEPNSARDGQRADAPGMGYKSCYFELAGEHGKFLREGGYRMVPFVSPRWSVCGVDTYGTSPGMGALGDVKQLQKMEEKKLKALDKMVDPPMNAPASMRGIGGTIVPGGVNYIPEGGNGEAFRPAFQVNFDIGAVSQEIDVVERRIRKFFFNDLFLSVLNEGKQMTAEEVARRHEEKLTMLGPVLERLDAEFLDPVVDRTFEIAQQYGILPDAPEEIQGQDMKIEYISLLAQAQKMVGMSAIQQWVGIGGQLAAVKPEVLDKINGDQVMDESARMLGVPPTLVISDDDVEEVRAERAQQAQKQQMAAMAQPVAQAAAATKDLADAKMGTGDRSALDALMGG